MSEPFDLIAAQLQAQSNNGGDPTPPQPPAPPAGDPPAGDPPAAPPATPPAPPAAPPAADPPAGDPPAGDPPAKKEWYEDDFTPPAPPAPPTNDPAKPQDPVDIDPDVKLLLEYKKSGKTLKDFVSEYRVEDLASVSDDDIVKRGIKETLGLTDEEQEQAIFEYENASILEKKKMARDMRQYYENQNQEKLKQLTGSTAQYEEHQQKAMQLYQQEADQYTAQIVDKEVFGLKLSAEMVKEVRDFAETQITFQRPDGTFDIEKLYTAALWLKYGKEIVKANVTKARNEGKEQIIQQVSNPSANRSGNGRVVGSGDEALAEAFNGRFQPK